MILNLRGDSSHADCISNPQSRRSNGEALATTSVGIDRV